MKEKLVEQIKRNFLVRPAEELLAIWKGNDRKAFPDETFEAIRRILTERNIELPAQPERPLNDEALKDSSTREDLLARQRFEVRAVYGVFRVQAFVVQLGGLCLLGAWIVVIAYRATKNSHEAVTVITVSEIACALGVAVGVCAAWIVSLWAARSCRNGGGFWKVVALLHIIWCCMTFLPPVFVTKNRWMEVFLVGRLWTLPLLAGIVHLLGLLLFAGTFIMALVRCDSLKPQPVSGYKPARAVLLGIGLLILCGTLEFLSRYIAWSLR